MSVNSKKKNRIWAAFLGMILALLLVPQNAQAAVAVEVGADVSLKIEYKHNGTKISGATFDIYKVAEVSEVVEFTKTDDFEEFDGTLKDLDKAGWNQSAKEFADFVKDNEEIQPFASGVTDDEGVVSFPNKGDEMTTGLYLVIGKSCESNGVTYSCDPFFICLPNLSPADQWIYDETAAPKASTDTVKDVPKDSKLPQTGMLKWPIPVLAGTGILFFVIGWTKRQKDER